MTTLPNMSIITPTLGGDSGTWDDKINAAFGLIDAHDHTSGKGLRIVTSALNINADLTFAGFGATNLGKAAFSAVAALAAGSKTLFVSSADNELYWRNNSGTNVKLTSGATINTSLVGGIGGDYSTVGADLDYDDANKRYTFHDETGAWARIATGPVRIHEYNTTETVYVEHAVAAGLAASYTVTWPAALPGATAIVQISAAGAVSFSNTIVEDLTMTSGKSVVLSGAGKLKMDERLYLIAHFDTYDYLAGGAAAHVDEVSGLSLTNAAADTFLRLPAIPTELRVTKIEIGVDGANTGTMTLMYADDSDGTYTAIVGATGITVSGGYHTLTPTTTMDGGTVYRLKATPPAAGTQMILRTARVYVESV